MIIILCDNRKDAEDAFNLFCSFLDRYEPFMIQKEEESALRIVTDDDLVYIFIDHRFKGIFDENHEAEMIEVDEFFEDLYSHYDADIFEDFHYGWIAW